MENRQIITALVLNLPLTILGLLWSLLSFPKKIKWDNSHTTFVLDVKRLWLNEVVMLRRVKGFTLGNAVLLSGELDNGTYNHEIVHIEQFSRMPLIFPIFYLIEWLLHGYKNNKYEIEARSVEINPG